MDRYLLEILHAFHDEISPEQRRLYDLAFLQRLSVGKIAALTGRSEVACLQDLESLRKALAAILSRFHTA